MSSKKPKRPSSARRNIKQELFSSYVSSSRLRNVQEILKSTDVGVDSILCILGIDSRYNEGSLELANYLLFDFFDSRREELESSGYPDEIIDDLVILINHDAVHVYCNPVNYLYLLPYLAHWGNLRIHCLKEVQDDNEEAEEFKIESFIAMATTCGTIGIPYNRTGMCEPFDKFAIEKWPLVQAFALEGFGGGGFFTMKHEVRDISSHITKIYSLVDPAILEHLVTEELVLFERQWDTVITTVEVDGTEGIPKLTDAKVVEPLQSYFNHGQVVSIKAVQRATSRHPYVLFGTHSTRDRITDIHHNGQKTEGCTVVDCSLDGADVSTHMICQAVSPKGPLCCARSYFFGSACSPYPLTEEMKSLPHCDYSDRRLLSQLYASLVDATLRAIHIYSESLSASEAKAAFIVNLGKISSSIKVDLTIEAYDNCARQIKLVDGESNLHVKTARGIIYDIHSQRDSSKVLGSLVYAESFIDSSINVVHKGKNMSRNSRYLILTKHIQPNLCWNVSRADFQISATVDKLLHSSHAVLGPTLINGESAQLLTSRQNDHPYEGRLWIYEKAIVFMPTQSSPVSIPDKYITSLELYDGDSPSVVAVLFVTYNPTLEQNIPMSCSANHIGLVFTPKSKAYKAFFSEVLSKWKDEHHVPQLTMQETVPEDITEVHFQLQQAYQMHSNTFPTASHMKKNELKLPGLISFASHLAVSSVGSAPVLSSHLGLLLDEPYDAGGFADSSQLLITIISGIPGSYKENLCTLIKNIAKDHYRWVILKRTADNTERFDSANLQQGLQAVYLKNQKENRKDNRPNRVIVLTPGFTDIVEVVQAIVTHPTPEVARNLKIGTITACVDPLNMFMHNRLTFPKLLDYCAQGWVNNIVFTDSITPNSVELSEAQDLIRAVNSNVALMLANKANIVRTPDLELIMSTSGFTEDAMIKARYLLTPGWALGQFKVGTEFPHMDEILLHFSQPLERGKFATKIKGLTKTMTDKKGLAGNIYFLKGRLRFTDSKTLTDVSFTTMNGSASYVPSESQSTPPNGNGPSSKSSGHQYFMIFTGCGLERNLLKNWLRSCVSPKPVKKPLKTSNTLTKEEKKKIHDCHHLDPLPDGWFYNGGQYVSMAGDRTDVHPNISTFMEKYIEEENEKIQRYNNSLDSHVYHDLFE